MSWLLNRLVDGFVACEPSVEVLDMTLDSRQVTQGSLFVALQGTQQHGLKYAATAAKQGACAILWESSDKLDEADKQAWLAEVDASVACVEVPNLSSVLGDIASRFYDHPSKAMTVIGITGTDGKTSVSHFIATALNTLGKKAAVMGTIGIGQPGQLQTATHTTPDVISVHKALADLQQQGFEVIAMEVSSHALDQQRVNAVEFDIAVLTNLTRDHLDYHHTLEAYAEAKSRLFALPSQPLAVLNLHDDFGYALAEQQEQLGRSYIGYQGTLDEAAQTVIEALKPKHMQQYSYAKETNFNTQGLRATLALDAMSDTKATTETLTISTQLLGDFNVFNLLATNAVLHALGISAADKTTALSQLKPVAGRMDKVTESEAVLVVVDYAHTPGALSSALKAIKKHTSGRIVCVFGCGGDRDKGKRPLMGNIAEEHAHLLVITDDNPRTESPFMIMNDIINGLDRPEHVAIEHDRRKAIRYALEMTEAGDSILIAGKGHETYQIVGDQVLDFDDAQQVRDILHEVSA